MTNCNKCGAVLKTSKNGNEYCPCWYADETAQVKPINQGTPVNAPVTNPTMPKDTLFVSPKDRIIVREVAIKAAVELRKVEAGNILDIAVDIENWILR